MEILVGFLIALAVFGCIYILGPWVKRDDEGTVDFKVKDPPLYTWKEKRTEKKYGNDE
jgi:hypothetical protein